MPEYIVTLTEAERNAILGAMYWSEHVELLAKLRAAAPADASLLDRLHAAEAKVAILETERRATYQAMQLILARNAATDGGGTYNDLLHWLDANRPQEGTE